MGIITVLSCYQLETCGNIPYCLENKFMFNFNMLQVYLKTVPDGAKIAR